MDVSVIKSYLVSLGFKIDNPSKNAFDEALRTATAGVGKFAGTMAKDVTEAGALVVGALTAIATATVGMMYETAKSDLQFQILGRRMYMTTNAAKEMKIALNALGVDVQDVIWGPKEIGQRYHQLLQDQKELSAALGPDFETQMFRIREIGFQFDRLRVAAQYFVMALTKDISKALTGDEDGLLNTLKGWVKWFKDNIPELASKFSTYLVPVLRDMKAVWTDIADIMKLVTGEFLRFLGVIYNDPALKTGKVNIDNIGKALDHVSASVRKIFDALDSSCSLHRCSSVGVDIAWRGNRSDERGCNRRNGYDLRRRGRCATWGGYRSRSRRGDRESSLPERNNRSYAIHGSRHIYPKRGSACRTRYRNDARKHNGSMAHGNRGILVASLS